MAKYVMAKRGEQKRETRDKILAAAASCFAEKGYSGCSVAEIAGRAGVSHGSLYVHFRNKESLFITMIAEEHAQGAEKARRASCSSPFLLGILDLVEGCIKDVGFPIDHRLWTEVLSVAGRDETVRKAFAASDRAMRDVFIELLEKAAAAGEIDGALDFEAVSLWIYSLVDGLIARTATDLNFDFAKHAAVFETLLCRALRPGTGE